MTKAIAAKHSLNLMQILLVASFQDMLLFELYAVYEWYKTAGAEEGMRSQFESYVIFDGYKTSTK